MKKKIKNPKYLYFVLKNEFKKKVFVSYIPSTTTRERSGMYGS